MTILKGRMGTVLVAVVLAVVLLIGTALFGYFGYRLLVPPAPPRDQVAVATSAPASPTPSPSKTPTAVRTPVVIVAPTAIPFTPGPMPTATAQDTTAGGTSPTTTRTPGGSETGETASGKLPQTGLGLSTPVIGLLLAGLASAARWLRGQRL